MAQQRRKSSLRKIGGQITEQNDSEDREEKSSMLVQEDGFILSSEQDDLPSISQFFPQDKPTIPEQECYYHPSPSREVLPSGFRREHMEVFNESPDQADKQRRNEERFIKLKQHLVKPFVCNDHDFHIGEVPESPKEPNISGVPMQAAPINPAASQASIQLINMMQMHNSGDVHNTIQASESDEKMLQVSFNIGKQGGMSRISDEQSNAMPQANLQRDLSFNVLSSNLPHQRHQSDADMSRSQKNIYSNTVDNRPRNEMTSEDQSFDRYDAGFGGPKDNTLDIISPCRKLRIGSQEHGINPWEKIVVTEEGVDSWKAQLYGVDIKNFPKVRPESMPQDLYLDFKRKYDVRYKVRAKKSNEDEDEDESQKKTEIKSRFMEWYKKSDMEPRRSSLSLKRPSIRMMEDGSDMNRSRRQSGSPNPQNLQKIIQETQEFTQTITDSASSMSNLMNKSGQLFQIKEQIQMQRQAKRYEKVPKPDSYKVAVYHKNNKVDSILAETAPTPEQEEEKRQKLALQERLEKERKERQRQERNRKTRIGLTQKQKVHVGKLFMVLGGSVTRKEMEKSAFDVHTNQRNVNRATMHSQVFNDVQPQSGEIKVNKPVQKQPLSLIDSQKYSTAEKRQEQQYGTAYGQEHKEKVDEKGGYSRLQSGISRSSNIYQTTDVTRPHSTINVRSNQKENSTKATISVKHNLQAPFGKKGHMSQGNMHSAQKFTSMQSYGGTERGQSAQKSQYHVLSQKPQKQVYRVFGVKQKQIQNKIAVKSRPETSNQAYQTADNDRGAFFMRRSSDMMNRGSHSAASLLKPPVGASGPPNRHSVAGSKSKKTITVVNARSMAAKIVLRNLQNYKHENESNFSMNLSRSLQKMRNSSQSRPESTNERKDSLSFLGQYVKEGEMPSSKAKNILIRKKNRNNFGAMQNSLQNMIAPKKGGSSDEFIIADSRSTKEPTVTQLDIKQSVIKDFNPPTFDNTMESGKDSKETESMTDAELKQNLQQIISNKRARKFQANAYYSAQDAIPVQDPELYGDSIVDESDAEYAQMLEHVMNHDKLGKKSPATKSNTNQTEENKSNQLNKMQPTSALFQGFTKELKEYQIEHPSKKTIELMEQARNGAWNMDTSEKITAKQKDNRILKKYIGSKVKSRLSDKNSYFNEQSSALSGLENFAKETPSDTNESNRASVRPQSGFKSRPESSQRKPLASTANTIKEAQDDDEDDDGHEQLYVDDPEFEIHDMLKDESEDEEPAVNFEINQHISPPIDLDSSHKYRNSIKDDLFDQNKDTMSHEEKITLMNQVRDADFWLQKGIAMTAHNQLSTAVQCYKQTLLLNNDHYVAMHNIAVCYERLDKFTSALKWFKRASRIKPSIHFTFIGAAVNLFKLGYCEFAADFVRAGIYEVERQKMQEFGSLDYIEKDDEDPKGRDQSQSFRATINDYNYVLTLCLRKLRQFQEAGKLYMSNAWFYRYPERLDIVHSLFGLLLLPLLRDRRALANELETIKDNLQTYKDIRRPIKRPLLGTFYTKKQWVMKFAREAAEELHHRSFFKRFRVEDLMKFLPKMKVRQHEADTCIFPDFDVCIILDGLIETKFHVFGDRIPKPLNKFKEGDILGYVQGDGGKSSHVETWSVCRSVVEAIWMERSDFAALWHLQAKSMKKMLCQVVRMQKCFQRCNELTVHMLAFELLKTKEFAPGQVIVPMNKRSAINEIHKESLKEQTNVVVRTSLANQKEAERKQGGVARRVSHWQLVLGQIAGQAAADMAERESVAISAMVLQKQHTGGPVSDYSHSQKSSMGELMRHHDKVHGTLGHFSHDAPVKGLQRRGSVSFLMHYDVPGLFIIETGRCKIQITDHVTGSKRMVAAIGRNDSFGGADRIRTATLDYLGEVVAGGDMQGDENKDRNVTCWYLSPDDVKRIPEFELRDFREIGSRKFKMTTEDMQIY